MSRRREEPKAVVDRRSRLRPMGEGVPYWTVPAKRAHVVGQIRQYNIRPEHNYWGRTPMDVRRQLIAEAHAGDSPGGA